MPPLAVQPHPILPPPRYLDAWHVREERLRGLGVVERTMTDGRAGGADRQLAAVEEAPGAVPELGSLVHDLTGKGRGGGEVTGGASKGGLRSMKGHQNRETVGDHESWDGNVTDHGTLEVTGSW